MSKKILYLTYDGLTDPLGQSQVLPYMLSVASAGFKVMIISFEKPEAFQKYKSEIDSQILSMGIEWFPLKYTKRPPVISTLWDLLKLKRLTSKLFDQHTFDVVHCRSYVTSLIGLSLKQNRGPKFIFDMRGFWADERVEGGIWNKRNPILKWAYNYFKRKEILFLQAADHIITLTHKSKSIIESWRVKNQPLPITVIPTCVDTAHFNPDNITSVQLSDLKAKLKIHQQTFVVTYIGSLGTWYMLKEMIYFFSILLKKEPESIFLIVTRDNPEKVYEYCKAYHVSEEKIRIASSSHKEIPAYISISNWSLFFIKPLFSKSASTPTKLAEILSMRKPVICNAGVGDFEHLFEKYSLGMCVSSLEERQLEKAIDFILKNRNMVPDQTPIVTEFSLSSGVQRLIGVYNSLVL